MKRYKILEMKNYNSKREDLVVPDEYNSILIRTEINVPEIPKMKADNK